MCKTALGLSPCSVAIASMLCAMAFMQPHRAAAGECAPLPEPKFDAALAPRSANPIADDFEADDLAEKWELKRIELHSLVYSRIFVKHGKRAVLLTVHHGDREDEGDADDRCSERAEVSELDTEWPKIGTDLWYGFSIYLPFDLPPIDRRLVLAQIKHDKERTDAVGIRSYEDGNPVLALRLRQIPNTETLCFSVTPGNDDPATDKKPMALVQIERKNAVGRWHNIVLHALIAPKDTANSRAEWWFDDQPVPRITNAPIALGYEKAADFSYFKMGPYRDQALPNSSELDLAWAFGYDEFKRDSSYQKAQPTPLSNASPLQPVEECKKFVGAM